MIRICCKILLYLWGANWLVVLQMLRENERVGILIDPHISQLNEQARYLMVVAHFWDDEDKGQKSNLVGIYLVDTNLSCSLCLLSTY